MTNMNLRAVISTIVLLMLMLITTACSQASQTDTKKELLQQLSVAYRANDTQELERVLKALIQIDPDPSLKTILASQLYQNHLNDPIKLSEAVELLGQAAQSGDKDAQILLGVFYSKGSIGLKKDKEKATKYFDLAIKTGDIEALTSLAQYHLANDSALYNEQEGFKLMKQAAEKGSADAQYLLGLIYFTGKITPRDTEKGLTWLKLAAENNSSAAQTDLANLYRIGKWVPKDINKALNLYQKAIEQNDANAMRSLGVTYLSEPSLFNAQLGIRYLEQAAQQNDERAIEYLIEFYSHDDYRSEDKVKAWTLKLKEAKEQALNDPYKDNTVILESDALYK